MILTCCVAKYVSYGPTAEKAKDIAEHLGFSNCKATNVWVVG